jgi:DNA-binding CsgD family transcriptional regulator
VRVVLARRSRDRPVLALERVVDARSVDRLDIGPLSAGATQLLVKDRFGMSLSRPILHELHRVSAGNPFHALELARARSQDRSRDLALPLSEASIDVLVRGRLATLDDEAAAAALLVAANGRTPAGLLETLGVGAGAIDRGVDAGVLERSGGTIGFTHPLLAAAVYDAAGTDARRRAHRRIADAIPDPVQRGRHAALGVAGPDRSISDDLERASGIARGRGQAVAAADLAERAVALTPADALDDRHRRSLDAARAWLEAGDGERVRTILTTLLEEATGSRAAEALVIGSVLEPSERAVAMLGEALRVARIEPRLRATIHTRMAEDGRFSQGREWAERHAGAALRLTAAVGDDAIRARAMSIAAVLRFEAADPDALDLARNAHRLARQAGDDVAAREAATNVGHILTWSRQPDEARAWLTEQLTVWQDRDELLQAAWHWYLACTEIRAGRWDDADAHAQASFVTQSQYGLEFPQDHLPAARIALGRGDFDAARRHSERAAELAGGMLIPSHLAVLATIDLWTGELDRAVARFEEAETAAGARGFREPAMRSWRVEYGEALVRSGRLDDAEHLLDDWEPIAVHVGRSAEIANARRVRGLIATAKGDLVGAEALLDGAALAHAAAGDPFGAARARLALGVVHLRRRQKRLAREAFESAEQAFERLGAASWVAEARGQLARIGGRVRVEGLSPSEQRVAELVAQGHTNRDIAAALFVTERTVASHLTHVYSKLGISSRTQLARYVTRRATNLPSS